MIHVPSLTGRAATPLTLSTGATRTGHRPRKPTSYGRIPRIAGQFTSLIFSGAHGVGGMSIQLTELPSFGWIRLSVGEGLQ
jgi:hypothetical protein